MRRAEVEQENADILNELIEIKVSIQKLYLPHVIYAYIHTYIFRTDEIWSLL